MKTTREAACKIQIQVSPEAKKSIASEAARQGLSQGAYIVKALLRAHGEDLAKLAVSVRDDLGKVETFLATKPLSNDEAAQALNEAMAPRHDTLPSAASRTLPLPLHGVSPDIQEVLDVLDAQGPNTPITEPGGISVEMIDLLNQI